MGCDGCGRCCSYVALEVKPETVPWLELHGVPVGDLKGRRKVVIEVACKWRDDENRRCINHDQRPDICKAYLCTKAKGTE